MFGYVRPLKSELKIREFGQFEAAYCGLCHTLGREYGVFSVLFSTTTSHFFRCFYGGTTHRCSLKKSDASSARFEKNASVVHAGR